MQDQAGGDAVAEIIGGSERNEVAGADVEVFDDAVADSEEGFEVDDALVRTVDRCGSGDFQMKVEQSGVGCVVVSMVVIVAWIFEVADLVSTEGFHETQADAEFGLIGIEAVLDEDDGVQSEIVSEVVPHGDAWCDGGVATEVAAAGWEDGFDLGGEEETIGFYEERTWDDGEITEALSGSDAFFVFIDVWEFDDDSEVFGEGPFEFDF